MQKISVVVGFSIIQDPRPLKIKYEDEYIDIEKAILTSKYKNLICYRCRSITENKYLDYELLFYKESSSWYIKD